MIIYLIYRKLTNCLDIFDFQCYNIVYIKHIVFDMLKGNIY